jgi:hypothetical protein
MNITSRSRSEAGFDLMDVLVTVAIVIILAGMLVAAQARTRAKAKQIQCVHNLKRTAIAVLLWEGGDPLPMHVTTNYGGSREYAGETFRHFQVLSNELLVALTNELDALKVLVCPADTHDGASSFTRLTDRNISYFIDLDADDSYRDRFFIGDRNVIADNHPENNVLQLVPNQRASWTKAMHRNQGNLGFPDASVRSVSNSGLCDALKNPGAPANIWRLALPNKALEH